MKLTRAALAATVAVCVAAAPLGGAQLVGKVWKIGILSATNIAAVHGDEVRQACRELGYVEG